MTRSDDNFVRSHRAEILAPFLSIAPPGGIPLPPPNADDFDRPPEVAQFARTRSVGIDLLSKAEGLDLSPLAIFRQRLEARRGGAPDQFDPAKAGFLSAGKGTFYAQTAKGKLPFKAVPEGSLLLRHPTRGGVWLLEAKPGKTLDFALEDRASQWANVAKVTPTIPEAELLSRFDSSNIAEGVLSKALKILPKTNRATTVTHRSITKDIFGRIGVNYWAEEITIAPPIHLNRTIDGHDISVGDFSQEAEDVWKVKPNFVGQLALDGYTRQKDEEGQGEQDMPKGTVIFYLSDSDPTHIWAAIPSDGVTDDDLFSALRDKDQYDRAWKEMIKEVIPLRTPGEKAPWSTFGRVDFSLQRLVKRFKELDILKNFEDTIAFGAGHLTKIGERAANATAQEIELLRSDYVARGLRKLDIDEALAELQREASHMGYVLAMSNTEKIVLAPDIEVAGATAGKLYNYIDHTYSWVTRVPREVQRESHTKDNFGKVHYHYWKETVFDDVTVYKTVSTPIEVNVQSDPLRDSLIQRQKDGYRAFVFKLSDGGYVTEEGDTLRSIMRRCESDEKFRRSCALFIPTYTQSVLRGLEVESYLAITAPLPGMRALGLPQLFTEEHYSYRIEWIGTELGELLQTIALAPGESREVTVSREYNLTRREARSTSSLVEISRSDTTELAEGMELEASHETSETRATNWNVKAGGKLPIKKTGELTGEASTEGTSTRSARDFTRRLDTLARKAARSIQENTKVDIRTEVSTEQSASQSSSSTTTIANINQGRTLNLLFYKLYNVYRGGSYIDKLNFVYVPSRELVHGTGVREPLTFGTESIDWAVLYYALDAASMTNAQDELADLTREILASLWAALENDVLLKTKKDGQKGPAGVVEAQIDAIRDALGDLTMIDEPILPAKLTVPSRGVYLDALVGSSPATERYSEDMRAAELSVRQAEAARIRAQADKISGSGVKPGELMLRSPTITDVRKNGGRLIVGLSASPVQGMFWEIWSSDLMLGTAVIEGQSLVLRYAGDKPERVIAFEPVSGVSMTHT